MIRFAIFALLTSDSWAGFNEQQRKNIQTYLETPHTRAALKAAENHEKVRRLGLQDDFSAALSRLGPDLELSLKTALLRMVGANESDGIPERQQDSMFLPELHQDVEIVRLHLAELVKEDQKRRLQRVPPEEEKPRPSEEEEPRPSKSDFTARENRYSVTNEDGLTWHRVSLAGPMHSLDGERRLFGDCTLDTEKVLAEWKTVMGVTSSVTEELAALAGVKCAGEVKSEVPSSAVNNDQAISYCETAEGFGLVGYTCPSYPGFTANSSCSVQKDKLPGGIDCKFEVVLGDSFSLTFDLGLSIGYGGSGASDDLIAEVKIGTYTSQFPRPCLGLSDTLCESMATLAAAMQAFVDIGGALAGKSMEDSMDLYPVRFSFPKDFTDDTTVFRIPVFANGKGSGAQTEGISLEGGEMCMSTLGTKMKQLGHLIPSFKLLGFALSMTGSDICVSTPGVTADAGSLKLGLQIDGYALDSSKVKIDALWDLFPSTLSPLVYGISEPIAISGLKALFEAGGGNSLNSLLEKTIKGALPAEKVSISLDVAKLLANAAPEGVVVQSGDSYVIKFDNFFDQGRRLSPAQPLKFATFEFPASYFAEQRRLQAARHLQGTFALPSFIQAGTKCVVNVQGMPKTLQCDFALGLANVTATLRAQSKLMYDLDGISMVFAEGYGFTLDVPETDLLSQGVKDAIAKLESMLDIGGMIDESLTGGITLSPLSISLPPNFKNKSDAVLEMGRLKADELRKEGLCLSTMKDLKGVPDAILDLAKSINTFAGAIGGDACVKSPDLDISKGFTMNMISTGEVFNKDKVDIWPIIETIGSLNPFLSILTDLASAVMDDDMRKQLNEAVAKHLLDQATTDITFDVGKALYEASSGRRLEAEEKSVTLINSNGDSLKTADFLKSDGTFDLGGYPASAAPGSQAVGQDKGAQDSGSTSSSPRSVKATMPLILFIVAAATAAQDYQS